MLNVILCVSQNAEYLLRHRGLSSLDMAQYVFWTGDEEGVARAVEEFIQKGLVCKLNIFKYSKLFSSYIDFKYRFFDFFLNKWTGCPICSILIFFYISN